MAETEWDSKTVIGFKAKAPKVTRNTSDLNGTPLQSYFFVLELIVLVYSCTCTLQLTDRMYADVSPIDRLVESVPLWRRTRRWLVA